jgi:hypothetical protein
MFALPRERRRPELGCPIPARRRGLWPCIRPKARGALTSPALNRARIQSTGAPAQLPAARAGRETLPRCMKPAAKPIPHCLRCRFDKCGLTFWSGGGFEARELAANKAGQQGAFKIDSRMGTLVA